MATYRKIKDLSPFEPRENNGKRKVIWVIVAVVLLAAVFLGAYWVTHPWIFNPRTKLTIEIHHSDRYVERFEVMTQKEFLLEVLQDEDLVTVQLEKNGCVITAAGRVGKENLTAGYATAYWAVYEGEKIADTDISQLYVADGKTYKIVYSYK